MITSNTVPQPHGRKISVVNVIVETPKGRRSRFEIDKQTGRIKLDRYLYSATHYPGDYGFIPQTLADDGDALDAIVMVSEATFPGCLIEARMLGLFRMSDRGSDDFKVLTVPDRDPLFSSYQDIGDVPQHFLVEVEHFFQTYKQLESAEIQSQGWANAAAAREELDLCIQRWKNADT